jgi:DNA-binding transcriptional regulator YiaG
LPLAVASHSMSLARQSHWVRVGISSCISGYQWVAWLVRHPQLQERRTVGSHRSYRQRKYEFSTQLFQLRTRLLLTQGQLAEQIGVHWHSVQKWETGEAYPKAETLQRLIAVCLRHHAFTIGSEREEAQALWRQVSEDGQRRNVSRPFGQIRLPYSGAFAASTPPDASCPD